jgi:hypothetical protein
MGEPDSLAWLDRGLEQARRRAVAVNGPVPPPEPGPSPPAPEPEPPAPEPSPQAGKMIPAGPMGGPPSGDLIRYALRRMTGHGHLR